MSEDKEKKQEKPQEFHLTKTIGKATYFVTGYFSQTSKESLLDKIKRMIMKDIQSGDY